MVEQSDVGMKAWLQKFDYSIQSKMDLPYPTMKKANIVHELSHLDKLARSILLSTRQIPKQDSLPKAIKSRIQKAISADNALRLCHLLEKEVIRFDAEIGIARSGWNILHCCAKSDSSQCIEYVLKTQYQEAKEEYQALVNSRTVEGYTPLIVAIINKSHSSLEKILMCGGVDIHIIDEHKMSPYEIALNYRNDRAIRLLMNYQSHTKKKEFINEDFLSQPVVFPTPTRCNQILNCLVNCISLGFLQGPGAEGELGEEKGHDPFKISDFVVEEETRDYVPIGSRKNLPGYDIEWKRAAELMEGRVSLFESYNPFDTLERNFTIKNNLIIFQCLTNQSWLLRKAIRADRCRNNTFNVTLYVNHHSKKITVDDYIPYIKDRNEAMFLSSSRELWPMILQKALAKAHEGYFSLAEIPPEVLIEELTGFPTFEKDLSLLSPSEIFEFLHQLSNRNYLSCLKGKRGSLLCEEENSIDCFNILNFYEKNGQNLVLVNCPFVSESWKKKEKDEPLPLKLIKGHYNTHNQMCVWVNMEQLKDYFSSIIVSNTFQNYERSELKITSRSNIFFKFRVEKSFERTGNHMFFQLHRPQDRSLYSLQGLRLLKNEGIASCSPEKPDPLHADTVVEVVVGVGEYMGYMKIEGDWKEAKQLELLCWSPDLVQPQFVEEQFGILEWFGFLKTYFKSCKEEFSFHNIGSYSLILLREKPGLEVYLRCDISPDCIIEGRRVGDRVEMVCEERVYYCVLSSAVTEEEVTFDIV